MNEIGLLYSQVGYDVGSAKKAVLRGPADFISKTSQVEIVDEQGHVAWTGQPRYWGPLWKTHWWTLDFSVLEKVGCYSIRLLDQGKILLEDAGLEIGLNLLFEKTAQAVALRNFHIRAIFSVEKPGWMDAGVVWQEVMSHSAALVGLCDMHEFSRNAFSDEAKQELDEQIAVGCDYLVRWY